MPLGDIDIIGPFLEMLRLSEALESRQERAREREFRRSPAGIALETAETRERFGGSEVPREVVEALARRYGASPDLVSEVFRITQGIGSPAFQARRQHILNNLSRAGEALIKLRGTGRFVGLLPPQYQDVFRREHEAAMAEVLGLIGQTIQMMDPEVLQRSPELRQRLEQLLLSR